MPSRRSKPPFFALSAVLLLAIVGSAQTPHPPATHAGESGFNCGDLSGKHAEHNASGHLTPEPTDQASDTHFLGSRAVPSTRSDGTAPKAELAVCYGNLLLRPSPSREAQLTIELRKPLVAGHTVAEYIHSFHASDGTLRLEIDLPEDSAPRITLALPSPVTSEIAIAHGHLTVMKLLGDTEIAIAHGDADLHAANADFASIESAAAIGGIRDRRPSGFGNHGHMLSSFNGQGTGPWKVQFAAASGHLNLLPPSD